MSKHDPIIRLLHMRDYVQKAMKLLEGKSQQALEEDEVLCLALTHLVELVGEAANKCPIEIRDRYSQIPWAKIISMRNRLIHGYDSVDIDILWNAITKNFPELIAELNKIIPDKT